MFLAPSTGRGGGACSGLLSTLFALLAAFGVDPDELLLSPGWVEAGRICALLPGADFGAELPLPIGLAGGGVDVVG
jgi:hypothetical protein